MQQLELNDSELMEEIPRMLTANNPNAPENIVMFSVKEKVFKTVAIIEQSIQAYHQDGWTVHSASDEARRQLEMEKMVAMAKVRNWREEFADFFEKFAWKYFLGEGREVVKLLYMEGHREISRLVKVSFSCSTERS